MFCVFSGCIFHSNNKVILLHHLILILAFYLYISIHFPYNKVYWYLDVILLVLLEVVSKY